MPPTPVPADVDAFLRQPNPAVVASLRPDGSPHTAATWYDWDGERVYLNMDHTRLRVRFMRRDGRIAVTVLDLEDWYRQVSLLGRIVRMEDDRDLAGIDRLSIRYRGAPYATRDSARVSAWMVVDAWAGWDSSRGGLWA